MAIIFKRGPYAFMKRAKNPALLERWHDSDSIDLFDKSI